MTRVSSATAATLTRVARTWQDLFVTGDDMSGTPEPEPEPERRGFFRRLRDNMSKTRQALGAELQATVFQSLDDEAFEHLEETLIYADVGAPTTAMIVERLETEAETGELQGGEDLSRRLRELLAETARVDGDTIPLTANPTVILIVGVNGSGKTTTIGKIAWHLQRELGRSVLIAAGDTFRAAAAEQLQLWAERAGCEIVRGEPGSDPGAVIFDAIAAARARGRDVVICDTAGRLHTQEHLMDELRKVRRVIAAQAAGAPHETLLTIDATTGQNGLRQAMLFREAVDVTGIVLTKLDGTAKGGIALAIAQELGVPVKLIGIGEALDDLRPFDPEDFARAILEP
jgi:fused signal recognition particle receptor